MMYALQIAAVFFGVALIALFNLSGQKNIKLLLAFSGSYLFSVVIVHFMPELFHEENSSIGLFILGGFLLQVLLDFYSTGLEHGHYHQDRFRKHIFPVAAIGGLFVHAFFEGIPIGLQDSEQSEKMLLVAIILHKVPITVVLYSLLHTLEIKSGRIWFALLAFAAVSPLGTFIGNTIPALHEYGHYLTAFATGIFLHVSTTILFESSHNHKYNLTKLLVVVVGMVLAYASMAAFSH